MSSSKKLLLISTTKIHGSDIFQYMVDDLKAFLDRASVKEILFIPYALKDHDAYTDKFRTAVKNLKLEVELNGIHSYPNPIAELKKAQAIFIGGGNTFRLLKTLYDMELIDVIRKRVLEDGVPYIGSSAGTNVATVSINTTNDMPIVYPPSLNALNLVPFNINPHFIDPEPGTKHMGETREERIIQYHEIEGTPPVVGLPEGAYLSVEGNQITTKGLKPAIVFYPGQERKEYAPGSDLSFLLKT